MQQTCDDCENTFIVVGVAAPENSLPVQKARFCPACGNELDTEKWPFLAFSTDDLWLLVGDNSQLKGTANDLFNAFVSERGKSADRHCRSTVMEVLSDEFEEWFYEHCDQD